MSRTDLRRRLVRAACMTPALAGLVLLAQGALIPLKAVAAQVLLDHAFERTLATGRPVRPWPGADTAATARIEAPRLHKRVLVLEGASGQALAFAAAHIAGTASAGEAGAAVYAAHRDTHFAFLGEVRTGDLIQVQGADGRKTAYRVDGAYVAPWNASRIGLGGTGRRLALVTCWPLDGHRHGDLRYIVTARAEPGSASTTPAAGPACADPRTSLSPVFESRSLNQGGSRAFASTEIGRRETKRCQMLSRSRGKPSATL